MTEKKILKRFETTDLLTERRFEQVTKTMNNVFIIRKEKKSLIIKTILLRKSG